MPVYNKYSDEQLTKLLQAGDESAYTELYNRYWALLFKHAYRMLRDEDDALDVVQEVFTTLWKKAESLTFRHSIAAFLYTTTRNKVLDTIDKRKVRNTYIESLQHFAEKGEYITDNAILEKELSNRIEKEIENLPSKMRHTFLLSKKHNLSHREIAKITETSEATVKKQIYNAMKILRPKFGINIISLVALFLSR